MMAEIKCTQSGCEIATSGRCLEGFVPTESCPHVTTSSTALQQELPRVHENPDGSFYSQDKEVQYVRLPSGEGLNDVEAAQVAASAQAQLIIIAGPYGSGKTTILTALFDAFQEAPFANFTFRGSRTLIGFEQRCHLGRAESGQSTAKTAHTSVREGVVFLHLDLAFDRNETTSHRHLLLSDISGELFRKISDSADGVDRVRALARADHLCIVIDGEKLASKAGRHAALNESRTILRSILESNRLSPLCQLDMIISKWDVVIEAIARDESGATERYVEDAISTIGALSANHQFNAFKVAARPPVNAKTPFAHGLPTLLRSWVGDAPAQKAEKAHALQVPLGRQMYRYSETVLARAKAGLGAD